MDPKKSKKNYSFSDDIYYLPIPGRTTKESCGKFGKLRRIDSVGLQGMVEKVSISIINLFEKNAHLFERSWG